MARVALVCEPPDGGVAEHVAQLALGLGAHGHEPHVFAPAGFLPAPRLAAAGVPLTPVDLRRDYGHLPQEVRSAGALARRLRAGRFDLVHAHAAKAGVLGRLAARAAALPAVYTPHCFPFVGDVPAARRRFGLVAERALAPLTAATICVCEDERRIALAARVGRPERLAVVLNGTPACPAVEPAPELTGLREGGVLIGAVTVLRAQKRVDVLLDAIPRVLAEVPAARFAVVGDGPERPALAAQAARLGLEEDPRVVLRPFTAPAARHLAALDVYVLPSAWEAFPIGVLEALACGVPQVATAVGGTPEAVVPATGVLVPPRDAEALAAALIELAGDPARRAAMARASRERHAARFTVEAMVAGTAEVYEQVQWGPHPIPAA